jgi:hypothetical protein
MHRHAVEYSTYPRGPRSGPGCSVPRRTQILLRNVPSSGTVSRLNQRSRARRSATISDRSSAPFDLLAHGPTPPTVAEEPIRSGARANLTSLIASSSTPRSSGGGAGPDERNMSRSQRAQPGGSPSNSILSRTSQKRMHTCNLLAPACASSTCLRTLPALKSCLLPQESISNRYNATLPAAQALLAV